MDSGKIFDLLVIGGGINGTGIALDAAGRGLSVVLCEKNDLGSGTSSASTKLIHGGLRYLEHYDFKLVREALNEREVLLKKAPHLISPLRLVIPYHPSHRPKWMIQLGLWLYDHLGKRCTLPKSKKIDLKSHPTYAQALVPGITTGFAFSDCWVDDARLVIANAIGAVENSALIKPYCEVTALTAVNGYWLADVYDAKRRKSDKIHARAVVNATGPWVSNFKGERDLRLVRGSHIVVPKQYSEDHAYLIQHTDGRVIFVIPYENDFTLIGTTEIDTDAPPDSVKISQDEIQYLIAVFNQNFKHKINPEDIVWSYSGVRPLIDEKITHSSALSRDYVFDIKSENSAPILTVYGGKITTYRTLAEAAVNELRRFFTGDYLPWTSKVPLPGGDISETSFTGFLESLSKQYHWVPAPMLKRLAKQYGTRIHKVLTGASSLQDLGQNFGADCYEQELLYLIHHEWARTSDDLLYRRTKLGLHLSAEEKNKINDWLKQTFSL